MDLTQKILNDLKLFYGFQKISTDFMNFKDSLKKIIIKYSFSQNFNAPFYLFYFFFTGELEI